MQPVALVTGAGRRIGAAIADFLHAKGYRIIIHCNTSQKEARELAKTLNADQPNTAEVLIANLDSLQSVKKLLADSLAWAQRLDVIVNNASLFSKDASHFDAMLLLNLKIPYWLSKEALPSLKATQGCIINITDTHASTPLLEYSAYCQTKAALKMQTKALAKELAPEVRVNAVAPGAIIWPEAKNSLSNTEKQTIISKTALKKHGSPLNIAKAVFSLIDNDFITGHELIVDGGRNL